MDTLKPFEITEADATRLPKFDVEINTSEYARCYAYSMVVTSLGKDKLVRIATDDDMAPRAYQTGDVLFVLTGNKVAVWRPNDGTKSHDLTLVDQAVETPFGVLVIYHLGCARFDANGAGLVWDYRYDVLEDFSVQGSGALLRFDDGTTHEVDIESGVRKL